MKIVIAPNSFKESLSAMEVATEIEAGFREVLPEATYVKVPVADGGEGTVEAMVAATDGRIVPRARHRTARRPGRGVLRPDRRRPDRGHRDGRRQRPDAARSRAAQPAANHDLRCGRADPRRLGPGGASTSSSASAAAPPTTAAPAWSRRSACACSIDDGNDLGFGGGELEHLGRIDVTGLDPRLEGLPDRGRLRRRQSPGRTERRLGDLRPAERRDAGDGAPARRQPRRTTPGRSSATSASRWPELPGAGAAGGLGAAMYAFLGAELRPGIEIVTAAVGLDERRCRRRPGDHRRGSHRQPDRPRQDPDRGGPDRQAPRQAGRGHRRVPDRRTSAWCMRMASTRSSA